MAFIQKNLWLLMLAITGVAFIWTTPGILVKPYLSYILMVMMFLSCLKVDVRSLREVRKNWWRFLLIIFITSVIPAFIVWIFRGFITDKNAFVGFVLIMAAPSAISAVALSNMAGGDAGKALIGTTLANLLSPLLVPFLVWWFAREVVAVNFVSMLVFMLKLVIAPFFMAQIVRNFDFVKKSEHFATEANIILLIILLWGIISPARDLFLSNLPVVWRISAVILVVAFTQVVLTLWFGRNRVEDITWVTLAIYRNLIPSALIAMNLFGMMALLPSIVYTVVGNLIYVFLLRLFKMRRWAF